MRPLALGGRPLTRVSRIGFTVVLLVALAEVAAFGARYLLTTHRYVITENAQVDADAIRINAPISGLVSDWRAVQGSSMARDQVVGRIRLLGSGPQPGRTVRAPVRGTVARNTVANGEYVSEGTTLAIAYDAIYITARVSESDIRDVRPGQTVDITADAYPDVPITGVVTAVQDSSAGAFLLDGSPEIDPSNPDTQVFPGPDTDPTDPQRVDQYYPVRIAFTQNGAARLSPGMNVSVRIHKL